MNASTHRFSSRLEKIVNIALALLFILCAIFYLSRLWLPVTVDTNLKNLSPALSDNPELRTAIDWLSSSLEQRFILLLEADDEDKLFDIAELLEEKLSDIDHLITPQGDTLSALIPVFARHPFHFLSAADRKSLQSDSAAQGLFNASQQLYAMPSGARLLPLTDDPFNLLSHYLLEFAETLNDGKFNEEGLIVRRKAGQDHYYLPLMYNIPEGSLSMAVQAQLTAALDDIEQQFFAPDPSIRLYRSGIVFYAAEAAKNSKQDISMISLGSSLGVLILLTLAFPSPRTLIIPLLSIVFGIAFAFAATHSIYSSLHILTIVFGASLIGIVIDYAIHYFFHWHTAKSPDKRQGLYRALSLSLITSSIGYGALGLSDLVSLQQIAVFSCFGLIAAWLCIIALSPKFISPHFQARTQHFLTWVRWSAPLMQQVNRLPKFSLAILLLLGFSALLLKGLPADDNPRNLFKPSMELLRQDQQVSQTINDYEPGKYIVVQAKNEQMLYQQLNELRVHTANTPLMTLLQWLPSPATQQANYALQQGIYQAGGAIETLYRDLGIPQQKLLEKQEFYTQQHNKPLTISELFTQTRGSTPPLWVNIDGWHYAFALIPKGSDLTQLQQVINSLNNAHFHYIDTLSSATNALRDQRIAASGMLIAAFALIAGVLLLRYRKLSCLSMLSVPLCSSMVVVICLYAMGIGITLFHTVALFLVLGLGMDYVIFARESQDNDPHTMAAILVSTLTSLLSFGLLALSSLSMVSAIGTTVLIGNLCNFFAVLAAYCKRDFNKA